MEENIENEGTLFEQDDKNINVDDEPKEDLLSFMTSNDDDDVDKDVLICRRNEV